MEKTRWQKRAKARQEREEKTERLRGWKGLHIEKRIEFIEEGKESTERGKESRGARHYYH